jgi:hypothetical protein
MIEHAGLYVLWVCHPMPPMLAIACGISRAEMTQNFMKKKNCFLS